MKKRLCRMILHNTHLQQVVNNNFPYSSYRIHPLNYSLGMHSPLQRKYKNTSTLHTHIRDVCLSYAINYFVFNILSHLSYWCHRLSLIFIFWLALVEKNLTNSTLIVELESPFQLVYFSFISALQLSICLPKKLCSSCNSIEEVVGDQQVALPRAFAL